MIANFSLACQIVTLLMLGVLILRAAQMTKHTMQIDEAIKSYRKEIQWLTARIEALESTSKKAT